MMKAKTDVAVEKFLSGFNCAQSVLYAFGPELGLDGETALKVATGLGGGMGGRGEVCGAVTGGILALGLKYGRGEKAEKGVTREAYQKTGELMAAFERVHGSCMCRSLLGGCDLRTPEGMKRFREEDLHHKVCAACVRTVGEILTGMLNVAASQAPEVRK
jgi:C_GCAxxG_C_C family probable redox protein